MLCFWPLSAHFSSPLREHFVQKRFPPYSAPITTRSVTPPTTSAYCFSSPRSFSKQSSSLFCEKRRSSQTFYGGNAYRKSCQHCTDYIFIYPLGMEMAGAATATATAPVISMLIMSVHFIKKNNRFHITKIRLSLKRAADICFLGVSSLVLELSSESLLSYSIS